MSIITERKNTKEEKKIYVYDLNLGEDHNNNNNEKKGTGSMR